MVSRACANLADLLTAGHAHSPGRLSSLLTRPFVFKFACDPTELEKSFKSDVASAKFAADKQTGPSTIDNQIQSSL